jgi:antitoxin component of RelBE/YafQ-DinJ toxin-antitoxin module
MHKYAAPRINREDLPNLTVRVDARVRKNVHRTAKAFGMKADHFIEVLFSKAYVSI